MESSVKELINDYYNRLNTIEEMTANLIDKTSSNSTYVRYMTKASCYRSFISELQKMLK